MLDSASKLFFFLLARSRTLKKLATRYGMRVPAGFARRFIAGETVAEAIDAARAVERQGFLHTLDHLGESVGNLPDAEVATRDYLAMMPAIVTAGVGRNLSLKLTQLGLDADKAVAVDNLRRILDQAEPAGFFVRIDMESSRYTDVTIEIFETLWQQGYRQIGIVLQSALHRTERDLRRALRLGARVRLVKGAYNEPKAVAYHQKADVDAAYVRSMKLLLAEGNYPALATHDSRMHDAARAWAAEQGIGRDRFEFQLLYGIRRDLQASLAGQGYRVRVYIPFGRDWFPYFMRRLGERPENVALVVRNIIDEKRAS
jgi:proline dehydrogenase